MWVSRGRGCATFVLLITASAVAAAPAGAGTQTRGKRPNWVRSVAPAFASNVGALTRDAAGNVYIVGSTLGAVAGAPEAPEGGVDGFVVKYSANGDRRWAHRFGSVGSDYVNAVTVGIDGTVMVAGAVSGALAGSRHPYRGNLDALVMAFDADGSVRWVDTLGNISPQSSPDTGNGVAVDRSGNAYLVGDAGGQMDGNRDGAPAAHDNTGYIASWNAAGNRRWVHQNPSMLLNGFWRVAVDDHGGVYVAGTLFPGDGLRSLTWKFGSDGRVQWRRDFTLDRFATGVAAITVTHDGAVVECGWTHKYGKQNDLFVVAFDATGHMGTRRVFESPANDGCTAITPGSDGSLWIVGTTDGPVLGAPEPPLGKTDLYVANIERSGNVLAAHLFGTRDDDAANGIARDNVGGVFVSGTAFGVPGSVEPNPQYDYFLGHFTKFALRQT